MDLNGNSNARAIVFAVEAAVALPRLLPKHRSFDEAFPDKASRDAMSLEYRAAGATCRTVRSTADAFYYGSVATSVQTSGPTSLRRPTRKQQNCSSEDVKELKEGQ